MNSMKEQEMSEELVLTKKQNYWLLVKELGVERVWGDCINDNIMDKNYEINEIEKEWKRRLEVGVSVLWESETNNREYCAKSGCKASVVYGKEKIGGRECYYVLTDDEGGTGYECCGKIGLYYSFDIEKYLEKCYEIDKNDFNSLKKILNREDYVSKKDERIKNWIERVE